MVDGAVLLARTTSLNRLELGREALEHPGGIERPPAVRPARHRNEVAAARIHRQSRLGRVPAVVPLDQVVDGDEAPARGPRGASARRTRPRRLRTRPRAPATRRRAAARALASRARSAVAAACRRAARRGTRRRRRRPAGSSAPFAQRPALERAPLQVLLEKRLLRERRVSSRPPHSPRICSRSFLSTSTFCRGRRVRSSRASRAAGPRARRSAAARRRRSPRPRRPRPPSRRASTPSASDAPAATSRAAAIPCVSGRPLPIVAIQSGSRSSGTFTPQSSSIRK